MKQIILIGGVPFIGKTTLAKRIPSKFLIDDIESLSELPDEIDVDNLVITSPFFIKIDTLTNAINILTKKYNKPIKTIILDTSDYDILLLRGLNANGEEIFKKKKIDFNVFTKIAKINKTIFEAAPFITFYFENYTKCEIDDEKIIKLII